MAVKPDASKRPSSRSVSMSGTSSSPEPARTNVLDVAAVAEAASVAASASTAAEGAALSAAAIAARAAEGNGVSPMQVPYMLVAAAVEASSTVAVKILRSPPRNKVESDKKKQETGKASSRGGSRKRENKKTNKGNKKENKDKKKKVPTRASPSSKSDEGSQSTASSSRSRSKSVKKKGSKHKKKRKSLDLVQKKSRYPDPIQGGKRRLQRLRGKISLGRDRSKKNPDQDLAKSCGPDRGKSLAHDRESIRVRDLRKSLVRGLKENLALDLENSPNRGLEKSPDRGQERKRGPDQKERSPDLLRDRDLSRDTGHARTIERRIVVPAKRVDAAQAAERVAAAIIRGGDGEVVADLAIILTANGRLKSCQWQLFPASALTQTDPIMVLRAVAVRRSLRLRPLALRRW